MEVEWTGLHHLFSAALLLSTTGGHGHDTVPVRRRRRPVGPPADQGLCAGDLQLQLIPPTAATAIIAATVGGELQLQLVSQLQLQAMD